ncbi:hypothetical protein ACNQVK_37470 [Mycobacterium sp. 134]|uniref:hypothetical protein n=1 Tax=Mycobacterium sp. 134 TaxID=3400425 RepID=UPI003AB08046
MVGWAYTSLALAFELNPRQLNRFRPQPFPNIGIGLNESVGVPADVLGVLGQSPVPGGDRGDVVAASVGGLQLFTDIEVVLFGGRDRGNNLAVCGVDIGDTALGQVGGLT